MNKQTGQTAYIVIVLVAIALLVGAFYVSKKAGENNQNNNGQNSSSTDIFSGGNSYDNQYINLKVADGWSAHSAANGAVNITKGNYILYIAPNATQASGVEGGRFAEIAQGSPSADAVIKSYPAPPCGTNSMATITSTHSLVNLDISTQETNQNCNKPTASGNYWYFSYVTDVRTGGYFNYYRNQTPGAATLALVVTVSYDTSDVTQLPQEGSASLDQAISDVISMLKTLQIKGRQGGLD